MHKGLSSFLTSNFSLTQPPMKAVVTRELVQSSQEQCHMEHNPDLD